MGTQYTSGIEDDRNLNTEKRKVAGGDAIAVENEFARNIPYGRSDRIVEIRTRTGRCIDNV